MGSDRSGRLGQEDIGFHLEDLLREASLFDPQLFNGRWYVTKDDALCGMTAVLRRCQEQAVPCVHHWVDIRNEIIQSGEWCRKCNVVRAGNDATSSSDAKRNGPP